jgi:Cu/Ag efflux protein CusF
MLRTLLCAVFSFLLVAGGLRADEYVGTIKKIDATTKTLTVTVDDKDKDFVIGDDTKIVSPKGTDLKGGLKSKQLKDGVNVSVTTEKKDDKEVVTFVRLGKKKKK